MDSRMSLQVAQEHIADLHRAAQTAQSVAESVERPVRTPVVALRVAGLDEQRTLRELAALNSTRPLSGESLVALVDGRLVAAISLHDGRVIADPFVPTAQIQALLVTRAEQLGARPRRRRRAFLRLRFA
jgi:hypothetical protein